MVRRWWSLLTGARHQEAGSGEIVEAFHRRYYDAEMVGGTWASTYWMGVQVLKCPCDLWVYQELIYELQPDWIIETGTHHGGSAHFMGCVQDAVGKGGVVTIDIDHRNVGTRHPRVTYLEGSSTSGEIVERVKTMVSGAERVLVILDSDHSKAHVSAELAVYADMVTSGSYLIVEDSNLNGHPVCPEFGPGPQEALQEFIKANPAFAIDTTREKFLITFNPNGFLKKA